MLDLQSTVGNRAVTQLVTQRKMAFASTDLGGKVSRRARASARRTGQASTFAQLTPMLIMYERCPDRGPQALAYLGAIAALSKRWLDKHPVAIGPAQRKKRRSVYSLQTAAEAERAIVRNVYWDALKQGKFKMLTGDKDVLGGKVSQVGGAEQLAQGKAPHSPMPNYAKAYKKEIAALTGKYRLEPAEIAAIRIYSDQDYRYINPAVAGITSWLEDNVGNDADLGQAVTEGGLHAEMAKWALTKLPKFDGKSKPVYRGEAVPESALDTKYKRGQTIKFDGFASTSKERQVSTTFIFNELRAHTAKQSAAKKKIGLGRQRAKYERRVGVLHIIANMRGGREIGAMSVNPQEKEVLFPPGTKFTVKKVTRGKGTSADPHIVESRGG